MYILFRDKNWKPSDYYSLPAGEKKIVNVFLSQELEERQKELDKLDKGR